MANSKGHIAFISDYGYNIVKELSRVHWGRGAMQETGAGQGGECRTLGEKTVSSIKSIFH